MSETEKKRLEEVKSDLLKIGRGISGGDWQCKHGDWLIAQAERVEKLKESLRKMKTWADHFWVYAEKILRPNTEIDQWLKDTEEARQILKKEEG